MPGDDAAANLLGTGVALAAALALAGEVEEPARNSHGVFGRDDDGDGFSDEWIGGTAQTILWGIGLALPYGEATQAPGTLSPGDIPTIAGGNQHDGLIQAKNQAAETIKDTAKEIAAEAAAGPAVKAGGGVLGFLFGWIRRGDKVNDARKIVALADFAKPITAEVTEAAVRLGFDLKKLRLVDDVAEATIDFSLTQKRGGLHKFFKFLQDNGAKSLRLSSGPIKNTDLQKSYLKKAADGAFNFGGRIKRVDDIEGLPAFEIEWDDLGDVIDQLSPRR